MYLCLGQQSMHLPGQPCRTRQPTSPSSLQRRRRNRLLPRTSDKTSCVALHHSASALTLLLPLSASATRCGCKRKMRFWMRAVLPLPCRRRKQKSGWELHTAVKRKRATNAHCSVMCVAIADCLRHDLCRAVPGYLENAQAFTKHPVDGMKHSASLCFHCSAALQVAAEQAAQQLKLPQRYQLRGRRI